jgi:DGQHR domain-containing protein
MSRANNRAFAISPTKWKLKWMPPRNLKIKKTTAIFVRALRTRQGKVDVYSFFLPGGDVTRIAGISRLERDKDDNLRGFQRKEIQTHVRSIVQYLNQGKVLFPNAITLAFSSDVKFTQSRGPTPDTLTDIAQAGLLRIPVRETGPRFGWIVDGQQRSLALANSKNEKLPVPVVAFVSDDLQVQREQFILMNKARPLPSRLINELLPETGSVLLPRELASRKIPSEICGLLNRDPKSPFHALIKRLSDTEKNDAVITDTAIIKMIRNSINSPLGALAPFKAAGDEALNLNAMYQTLLTFWKAVKEVFPFAWGLPPTKSRLMHSAGIEAMGILMDRMLARHSGKSDEANAIKGDLQKIAPQCHWIDGTWESMGLDWNEIQNTPKHIRTLADGLIRLYSSAAR